LIESSKVQKPFEVVKTEEFVPEVANNFAVDPGVENRLRDLETQAVIQKTENQKGKHFKLQTLENFSTY